MNTTYGSVSKKIKPVINNVWTIKDVVENTASLGDKVFLIDAVQQNSYTYQQSNVISNRIANFLLSMGLPRDERVGIYVSNRPEYIFSIFAVAKAGLIEVPINVNLRENEISHIIDSVNMTTIIVENKEGFINNLFQVVKNTKSLKNIILVGKNNVNLFSGLQVETYSLDEIISKPNDSNPNLLINESDPCAIFFTSGTTGLPKGAIISNKTFILAAQSVCAIPHLSCEDRNYTCLPLFHANAQLYSMTAMRCLGASLVLSDRFSPKKFWNEIIQYEATYFNSIGGMMQILDTTFNKDNLPDHNAKFVFVGGTPRDLWDRFENKFNVEVFEGYSLTEAPVLFGNFHPEKEERKKGSFGKPIFSDLGRETIIVDENNMEITVGTGELLQRGSFFVTTGYWDNPDAKKEIFDEQGWLHTGDIVRKDREGYHYFIDRKKFMIRVAGENVSAFEVEEVVNNHSSIIESVAIPVPDPIREEEIKILIKLQDGFDSINMEELIQHCANKLAYFKVPRFIEIVTEFPKTATERIKKNELKELEKTKNEHGWDRNKHIPNWRKRFFNN